MAYRLESQDWPSPTERDAWLGALNYDCETFEEALDQLVKMAREDYRLIGHSYPYRIVEV